VGDEDFSDQQDVLAIAFLICCSIILSIEVPRILKIAE